MPEAYRDELVFIPHNSVGEIGMNMAAYGVGPPTSRKWIGVDCGVTFAGPTQPGIELIMADPSFLEDNADDVLALILTHSHEDHYGAVLALWPAFDRPVYATAFAAALWRPMASPSRSSATPPMRSKTARARARTRSPQRSPH